MAGVEIAAEQRVLLGGGPVRRHFADQVAIGLDDPPHVAGRVELVDEHAHRDAGAAEVAGRPIGDGLRAPKTALGQDLVQFTAAPPDDVREDLPLFLARADTGRRTGR